MKKITPYIFLFLIFVNLFAPFTPDLKSKKLVSINKVEAEDGAGWYYKTRIDGTYGKRKAEGATDMASCNKIKDADTNRGELLKQDLAENCFELTAEQTDAKWYYVALNAQTKTEEYKLASGATDKASCEVIANNDSARVGRLPCSTQTTASLLNTNPLTGQGLAPSDGLPECSSWTGGFHPVGCIAILIYSIIWKPASWILAFSGSIFDFAFGYSVNSASYDTEFVKSGWGITRDICNMFFIFILLYVAIATILDLNHFKTKEMIINVVIIGVLINFSMLPVRLMVDASNILARVFYNDQVFAAKDSSGNNIKVPISDSGYMEISALIVGKFNPQQIVLNGGKKNAETIKAANNLGGNVTQNVPDGDKDENTGVTNGAFILITLLSAAMCIVGAIVFLSVSLIFVSRVIGLWFAMIFAPFAFFSYTVPALQSTKMFGWKNWWPETIKLCFLAPIFIFFLYLIVAYLGTGLGLADADNFTGMGWWIAVTVPFVFIMMLMLKAKDIAKEYSGSLGQSITNGLAAAGGLALGAGAAGLAVAGRNTIGQFGKLVANDGARTKALQFQDFKEAKGKIKGWGAVNPLNYLNLAAKTVTSTGKYAVANVARVGDIEVGGEVKTGNKKEVTAAIPAVLGMKGPGGEREIITPGVDAVYEDETRNKTVSDLWRENEKAPRNASHAKHIFEEKLKAMHIEDPWGDLGIDEQAKVRESIDKDLLAKQYFKSKDYSSLKKEMKDDIDNMYKGTGIIITENNSFGKKGDSIKDLIAKEDPHSLRKGKLRATEDGHLHDAEDLEVKMKGAGIAVGEFLAAVRKGTYDMRNLDQIKTGSKDFGVKSMVGLTAAVALGMRSGIKQSGVEYGKGSKDFMKDMGDIITSSLKSVKVVVPKSEGGGHDDHGGGHDDHGGGGHH